MRGRLLLVVLAGMTLLVQGCTTWPGKAHRDVTMDKIETVVARHSPRIELHCPDIDTVSEQLEEQRQMLEHMNRAMVRLEDQHQQELAAECGVPQQQPQNVWNDKVIVGETEWIYLAPPGHLYRARVDSGAATSSLSAQDVTRFERNGDKWVRFKLQHDDEEVPIEVERPIVRNVLIRQASSEDVERRPVIELNIHMGNELQQVTEFTLADRSHMEFPILLGRSFLQDVTLIDVGKQYLHDKYQPQTSMVDDESSAKEQAAKEKAAKEKAAKEQAAKEKAAKEKAAKEKAAKEKAAKEKAAKEQAAKEQAAEQPSEQVENIPSEPATAEPETSQPVKPADTKESTPADSSAQPNTSTDK